MVPDKTALAAFCRRHHVRKLSLFGSILRGELRPESDIDVLVEFEPSAHPTFFEIFEMEQELAPMFGGRRVDLRTPQDLSRHFREQVLSTAEVQFASG